MEHRRCFAQLGPAAVPALIEMLKRKGVGSAAAVALGRMDASGSCAAELLKDQAFVRLNAAAALGEMGTGQGTMIPALVKLLDDSDVVIRWNAVRVLGLMGADGKVAIPALTKSLNDTEESIRLNAVARARENRPGGESSGPCRQGTAEKQRPA